MQLLNNERNNRMKYVSDKILIFIEIIIEIEEKPKKKNYRAKYLQLNYS